MAVSIASTSGLFLLSRNNIVTSCHLTVMPFLVERLKMMGEVAGDDICPGRQASIGGPQIGSSRRRKVRHDAGVKP